MTKQTFTTGQVLTASAMTSLQATALGGGATTAKTASYVLVAADAGTVVQMNSASATTITVDTALFAAGDTVQIQNVGAGVCTVTAGTATVSTSATLALKQYDAGTLYFNTTSAAFFFAVDAADTPLTTTGDIIYSSSGSTAARLGIGSSAQVLTVAAGIPSWATASAPSFSGCRLTKDQNQTLTTANTWYSLTWQTETYDTNSYHNNTNNSRITVPSTGYYLFMVHYAPNSTVNVNYGQFKKNGSTDIEFRLMNGQTNIYPSGMSSTAIFYLAANDYIEFQVQGPSTGGLIYGDNIWAGATAITCQSLGA